MDYRAVGYRTVTTGSPAEVSPDPALQLPERTAPSL
jgi:hypothetical protein